MMDKGFLAGEFARGAVAHIAIDLQNYYCDDAMPIERNAGYSRRTRHYVAAVDAFADDLRQAGVPQFWFTHKIDAEVITPLNAADEGVRMGMLLDHAMKLSGRAGDGRDMYRQKQGFDCFIGTDLYPSLRERGVTTVLLTGVFKDVCVFDTALTAAKCDYNVVIVDDLSIWSVAMNRTGFYKSINKRTIRDKAQTYGIDWMLSRDILPLVQGPAV